MEQPLVIRLRSKSCEDVWRLRAECYDLISELDGKLSELKSILENLSFDAQIVEKPE